MKKIIYSILSLGALFTTSCELSLPEPNVIPDDDGMVDVTDCLHFRNGIYNGLRSRTTGAYIYYTDLAMDQFVGTVQNGNTNNNINRGNINSSMDQATSLWAAYYGGIVTANYFIERAQPILDEIPAAQVGNATEMTRYIAEAHFARAFYYYKLTEVFCPLYTDQTKDAELGMPLRTNYDPSSNKDTYPGRSTLAATYKFIEDELALAYDGLKYYEENMPEEAASQSLVQNSSYLNTWIVRALQARTALLKGDYANALVYANDIINNCKIYRLVDASSTGTILNRQYPYVKMWTTDEGSELMFRPYADTQELYIGSTGGGWLKDVSDQVNFLPVSAVLNYYGTGDVRGRAFLGSQNLFNNGTAYNGVRTFNKWPGNESLRTVATVNNLANMGKPFRLSEIYLIKMECEYMTGTGNALATLNNFRKYRIEKYTDASYSGDELYAQIKAERTKELIGEGFRMADLRRWKESFTRTVGLSGIENLIVNGSDGVHYTENDYRYVWPIPAEEIQVNPQLEGHQNPGYGN